MVEKRIAILTIKEAFLSAKAEQKNRLKKELQRVYEIDSNSISDQQYKNILGILRQR